MIYSDFHHFDEVVLSENDIREANLAFAEAVLFDDFNSNSLDLPSAF